MEPRDLLAEAYIDVPAIPVNTTRGESRDETLQMEVEMLMGLMYPKVRG